MKQPTIVVQSLDRKPELAGPGCLALRLADDLPQGRRVRVHYGPPRHVALVHHALRAQWQLRQRCLRGDVPVVQSYVVWCKRMAFVRGGYEWCIPNGDCGMLLAVSNVCFVPAI